MNEKKSLCIIIVLIMIMMSFTACSRIERNVYTKEGDKTKEDKNYLVVFNSEILELIDGMTSFTLYYPDKPEIEAEINELFGINANDYYVDKDYYKKIAYHENEETYFGKDFIVLSSTYIPFERRNPQLIYYDRYYDEEGSKGGWLRYYDESIEPKWRDELLNQLKEILKESNVKILDKDDSSIERMKVTVDIPNDDGGWEVYKFYCTCDSFDEIEEVMNELDKQIQVARRPIVEKQENGINYYTSNSPWFNR